MASEHAKRMAALDEFLAAFEAEHGQITEEEMREAARTLAPTSLARDGTPDSQRARREDA